LKAAVDRRGRGRGEYLALLEEPFDGECQWPECEGGAETPPKSRIISVDRGKEH
jgi:hypothetical protein